MFFKHFFKKCGFVFFIPVGWLQVFPLEFYSRFPNALSASSIAGEPQSCPVRRPCDLFLSRMVIGDTPCGVVVLCAANKDFSASDNRNGIARWMQRHFANLVVESLDPPVERRCVAASLNIKCAQRGIFVIEVERRD